MAEKNERNIMYIFFTILMYGNASKNIPYNLFLVSYLTIHASSLCSFRLTNYVFQFHSFLLHFHLLILLYSLFCMENFMLMRCAMMSSCPMVVRYTLFVLIVGNGKEMKTWVLLIVLLIIIICCMLLGGLNMYINKFCVLPQFGISQE